MMTKQNRCLWQLPVELCTLNFAGGPLRLPAMNEPNVPGLAKWPFLLGDLAFLSLAALVGCLSDHPMEHWLIACYVLCVGAGAGLAILPFLAEYRAAVKLAEAGGLATTVEQIKNLELVSGQIAVASSQLQSALDQSAKTVSSANEIATRMTTEAKAFADFMNKANDTEKAHLRLEVEKLRRTEADWVQVAVRMLDHTFALNQAAQRSGQANVVAQMNQFQHACRDVARRVGLSPFVPNPGDVFDAQVHQLADSETAPAGDARVTEVLATGFTFQGQVIRQALVMVQSSAPKPASTPTPDTEPELPITPTEVPFGSAGEDNG